MPDQYASIRSLSFSAVAPALGIDLKRFKERNGNWQGYCPVHGAVKNNTSFGWKADGRWNCLSCSAHGSGAIDLTKAVKQVGFVAAVEILKTVAPELPQNGQKPHSGQNFANNGSSVKQFDVSKYRKHAIWPCEWLEARGITKETAEQFGVFMYNNPARKSTFAGRVLIPFTDFETGKVDGYMGRYTGEPDDKNPKYLIPSGFEKSRYLFGASELARAGSLPVKVVFLVESPFCVMKFRQLGFCAVALYGWSLSEPQASCIAQLTRGVAFVPDANKRTEAIQSVSPVLSQLTWLRCPAMPNGVEDPEYLSTEQIRALLS